MKAHIALITAGAVLVACDGPSTAPGSSDASALAPDAMRVGAARSLAELPLTRLLLSGTTERGDFDADRVRALAAFSPEAAALQLMIEAEVRRRAAQTMAKHGER